MDSKIDENDPRNDSEISPLEKQLLERADESSIDEEDLSESELEDTDNDGDLLNEESSSTSISGKDLDVPGADLDDQDESIGEEDEENNSYSESDTE